MKILNNNQRDCIDFETRFCCPSLNNGTRNDNARKRREASDVLEPPKPNLENLPLAVDDLRNFILSYDIYVILMAQIKSQIVRESLNDKNEFKSNDIGDPALIGLSCESGHDISDCNLDEEHEPVPIGCEGVLIFSDVESTCGSMCESERSKRSEFGRKGWTKSYMNTDKPTGTGDHEHYFHYLKNSDNRRFVYDSDGTKYTNCVKKAIQVREKDSGKHWWALTNEFTLEWMAYIAFSKFVQSKSLLRLGL